ncbi:hypothetical protein [Dyadobacter sandarakinus]|uniref:Outer membrane protein beta-barrel domain-containing protein n=1 Tax=Dyadobacter sandarakinus TaxID=2747268 RepID=A0ABX7I2P6_9BACT|nr:hypothetical protein [Dyadobacter sandarakinus]QRR00158.1 hypothetical protein HWI92_04185 [Dyadobacter sandarakinus]
MKNTVSAMTFLLWIIAGPCHAQNTRSILPEYVSTQYAGSVGWMSLGAGYNLFKHRTRLGVQYGFVPKEKGGRLHILSSSFDFKPYVLHISNKFDFNPVDLGVKVSYHFGEQFHIKWPSRYPDGYYWWKSALRLHLSTETALTYKFSNLGTVKSLTPYLELNSADLYMVSYILNLKSLSFGNIIKAGVGLRIGL